MAGPFASPFISRSCGTIAAVSNYSKRDLIFLAVAIVVICMLARIVMFAEWISLELFPASAARILRREREGAPYRFNVYRSTGPLLQRTMEYDHAAGHSLVLLGEPYGTPIPRQRCCAVRELAVRHPIPPTPRHTACCLI